MNVYLAGPMRGYPEFNFPAFHAAAARLRLAAIEVSSPAEHDVQGGFDPTGSDEDFDLRAALRWDLEQVMAVEMVVVLPGWEKSKGAKAEVALAEALGTPVYTLAAILELSR